MNIEVEDIEYNLKCEADLNNNQTRTVIILVDVYDKNKT
ncbi:hypothetical protein ABIC84_000780 [Mucilaginibacter sp. 3215]